MPSRIIPSTGTVKVPGCSHAVEHSKKAASLDAGELNNLAILTKREAASLLRVTTRYIERAITSGRLRACKPTGKMLRIYRRDLDRFLEGGATIVGGPQ
jgi:excisionase family DNA binding protein